MVSVEIVKRKSLYAQHFLSFYCINTIMLLFNTSE